MPYVLILSLLLVASSAYANPEHTNKIMTKIYGSERAEKFRNGSMSMTPEYKPSSPNGYTGANNTKPDYKSNSIPIPAPHTTKIKTPANNNRQDKSTFRVTSSAGNIRLTNYGY